MLNHHDESNLQNMLHHLGRLSDMIFALAMALTILGCQLPQSPMTNQQTNHFLFNQLNSLSNYAIAFITVGFYWIDHVQQFKYYRKTNEIHLWLYLIYLLCLFLVPYSTALTVYLPQSLWAKIWFSINIFCLGMLSFLSWTYASYNHQLIDRNLALKTIKLMACNTLVEPLLSLLTIGVAFFNLSLWDWVWFLLPIPYIILHKFDQKPTITPREFSANNSRITLDSNSHLN
ncbi:TMEM175 family protein [Gloeothece verrucosa]|uniref:Integral membrane protein n=1 Tax=Gloeothece verrucosa (strain PCC 7822) TaxID=497965 RepID=E0U773_GLOV7|nr:TMEM175 family protein [Gloeothece verrucosa]ADN12460.1 protein of unknown function DUF1211 [Gloeothece verrucosa PCC 7822]